MNGSVTEFGNRVVQLLLVGSDGAVHDLTGRLKSDGGSKLFALKLQSFDAGPGQPQLLVTVVSDEPLETFKMPRPGKADEVFARALKEAQDTGQTIRVSAQYLTLEK